MHIIDSYLKLASAPLSVRKFQNLDDCDKKERFEHANLYIIAKREVPRIHVIQEGIAIIPNEERISIPLGISLGEEIIDAFLILPSEIDREVDIQEILNWVMSLEFDEIRFWAEHGSGSIRYKFAGYDSIYHLMTYEVLYVGQCVSESLSKRFKAHHALQDMLINEKVISKDFDKSEELMILPFMENWDIVSILNPNISTENDYLKIISNDFSFDSKDIAKDCEKALVHGMNPKYNKIRFTNYFCLSVRNGSVIEGNFHNLLGKYRT